jgi:hypothetical protein
VERFSWNRIADAVVDAYEDLASAERTALA